MVYDTPRLRAKAAGLKRYEGLPCINCGGTTRLVSSQECVVCKQAKKQAQRKKKQKYTKRGRPKSENPKPATPFRDLPPERKKELLAMQRDYWARNPEKRKAKRAKSRAKLHMRIPAWLSEEDKAKIIQVYKEAADKEALTGEKWEVDHIIPLNGKLVSGLHVPENLRVVSRKDNRSKSNIFEI